MKKLKYLPAMLMLVLCVGILAIGIYAIQPSKNTISGTITVNASSAEIGIQVYHTAVHADNLIKEYESVRSGVDIPLTHEALDYTMENVNSLDQVNETPKKVIIKITNKSGKDLGGYFFNPDSTLVDGKATKANIATDVTLDGKGTNADGEEVTETGLLKATFSGYTQIPAKDPADETQNGSAEIEISFELLKFVSYDMDIDLSNFNIQLNIEECNSILSSKQNFVVSSSTSTPFDIELIQDETQVATLSATGTQQTLVLDSLIFGASMPKQSVYSIKVTNKSETQGLGVYFHTGDLPTEDGTAEKGTEGVKAGYASAENIVLEGAIYNKDNKTEKLADVTLDPYSYIAVQDNETGNGKDFDYIEMEMIVTTTDNYSAGKKGEFSFELRVEPYVGNIASSSISGGTGGFGAAEPRSAGTSFSGKLLKLDDSSSYNISGLAFYENSLIQHLVVPSSVTLIGNDLGYATIDMHFYGCSNLEALSFCSNSVVSNGEMYGIFGGCQSLKYVKFGNTYTGWGVEMFRNCKSLLSVKISNKETTIYGGAFNGCESLSSIFIPNSVMTIGYRYSCWIVHESTTIYCEAKSRPTGWSGEWNILDDDVDNPVYAKTEWNVDRFGNSLG